MLNIPYFTNLAVRKTLQRLNLAGNFFLNLGIINLNLFPGMSDRLLELVLRRCSVVTIEPRTFAQLHSLQYINLAENQLKTVSFLSKQLHNYHIWFKVPEAVKLPSLRRLDISFQVTNLHTF